MTCQPVPLASILSDQVVGLGLVLGDRSGGGRKGAVDLAVCFLGIAERWERLFISLDPRQRVEGK